MIVEAEAAEARVVAEEVSVVVIVVAQQRHGMILTTAVVHLWLVAQIMIHQAMGGAQGQAEDIKAHKHTSVVGVTGAVRCLSD